MDEDLRSLLRQWQTSDRPEDEARYLRACLRVGSLGREHLRAAVWLGDEVAREVGAEVLGQQAVTLKPPKTGVANFLSGLPGGARVLRQAMRAAFSWVAEQSALDAEASAALTALYACFDSPGQQAVRASLVALDTLASKLHVPLPPVTARDRFAMALQYFASGWLEQEEEDDGGLDYVFGPFWDLSLCVRGTQAQAELRAAMTAALWPWVLLPGEAVQTEAGSEAEPEGWAVFTPELMTPEFAEALRPHLKPGKLKAPAARQLIEAYFTHLAWPLRRGVYVHPDGELRVKLLQRALRVEVGGPGHWQKHPAYAHRLVTLVQVGNELADQARGQLAQ